MKNNLYETKEIIEKVRNICTGEVYYTSNQWPIKEIDGVPFISVKRTETADQLHLMRKEGIECVK